MTRILLTGLAAAALLQPQSALASKAPYTCGTGRLLDVELVTDVVSNGTTSVTTTKRNKHGERKEYTHTTPAEHTEKTYFITIELDDMRYVARSSGNLPWNFNPTRMVINDPIGVCVDRKHLIVTRPDGKTYKASVVRASRDLERATTDRDREE
jgi:hypothetical protein